MPNIVNPAVAVAAKGGGKFLHCITICYYNFSVVVQFISEKEEPFSAQTFYDELNTKGFSSDEALYPCSGNPGWEGTYPSYGLFSYQPAGVFASGNFLNVSGTWITDGSTPFTNQRKEIDIEDRYFSFTDIVL